MPKKKSRLNKLFHRSSKSSEQNPGSLNQEPSCSSLPNMNNSESSEDQREPFRDIRTWGSGKRVPDTFTPMEGVSSTSGPNLALAQGSISALSTRPSSLNPPGPYNPGVIDPGLIERPCLKRSASRGPSPHSSVFSISIPEPPVRITTPIPNNLYNNTIDPESSTHNKRRRTAFPELPTASAEHEPPALRKGPSSDLPHRLRSSPVPLEAGIPDPPAQGCCTRTCAIWQKALEIAGQKLMKHKLPPLDYGHLKHCSHGPNYSETSGSSLVVSNVQELQVTIETKHRAGSGNGMGKLKDLLQTFSKYVAVVDVAVGHSPHITALVWAGIRLTIQVALNSFEIAEYLETVTGTLTEKIAMCEFYAKLYTDIQPEFCADSVVTTESLRTKLHIALPELYSAVLVYSAKARQYFTAHTGKKIAFALKTVALEFQSFEDELLKWEKEVEKCADAATMQRILASSRHLREMHPLLSDIVSKVATLAENLPEIMETSNQILGLAQENLKATHIVRQIISNPKEDEEKILKLLESLSPLEPQKRHQDVRSTRMENSGTWLLQHRRFRQWLECNDSEAPSDRILCCYGAPGAGKTLMSSIVIDHLTSQFSEQDQVAIACLYCDYRDQGNQTLENLLGSVLRQFLTMGSALQVPDGVNKMLEDLKRKGKRVETTEILNMMKLTLPQFRRLFVCIDALDELKPQAQRALLHTLSKELTTNKAVQLFLTGRHHISQQVNEILVLCQESIDIQANPDDIRAFLNARIALDDNKYAMNDSLKEDILRTIPERSVGMFLIPSLQIRIVLEGVTITERREALKTLPHDLGDSFKIMIERIERLPPAHAKLGMKVLLWLHLAYRPLKLKELQHALAVKPGDKEFNEESIPSSEMILNSCLGLVIVDEATSTVRFVHYTLEEFFKESNNAEIYFPDRYTTVADICLTYLNFWEVSAPCKREDRGGSDDPPNASANNHTSPLGYGKELEDLIELHNGKFDFLEYAACQWGHYVRLQTRPRKDADNVRSELTERQSRVDAVDRAALKLLSHVGDETYAPFKILYRASFNSWRSPSKWRMLGTHIAAFFGLVTYMSDLASVQGWGTVDHNGQTPLTVAARNGQEEFVRLLLQRRDPIERSRENCNNTELLSYGGRETVGKLGLKQGTCSEDMNPLSDGNEETQSETSTCDEVGINSRDHHHRTPLSLAAENGYEAVVRLLLEIGAAIDLTDDRGWTPLSYAARYRHEAVVRLLLERGAAIDSTNTYRWTPLFFAAGNGYEAVVRLLLERGAAIDSTNDRGWTPLSLAATYGHEAVVRLLLERGAAIDSTDDEGRTPLSFAAWNGHEAVVRLLLERGAAIDSADNEGRTPFSYAARNGHEAMVRLLRERGAHFT